MAADLDGHTGRSSDGALVEVDDEAVLGEQSAGCGGLLSLTARVDASAIATFLECPGSIGVVAIDSGDIFVVLVDVGRGRVLVEVVMAGLITDEKVGDEVLCDTRVPGVARRHDRDGDDLGVGVDRHMSLVAAEASGLGLVPVAGLWSVETGGREQIEVEYREAASADHEDEHDSAVRPPQCGLAALEGSRSVESVAHGVLLRN